MKSRPEITAPPEPQWDEYAPYLDESLARLSTDDREALTLRYLKGLPLREVGLIQQVTEEAARKRVQRALDRLRKMMSRRTTMPAVAVLGTTLAANSAHAAPAALTSTIVAAAPASASVGLIASAAQKSLWLLKAKVAAIAAAAAVVGVTTIAATTAILYHAAAPKPAVPPAQFVAASTSPQIGAADVDEKESTVPGEIQCVRWDVLLDAVELANLRKIAAPLKTSSTIYNAYAVSGVELRRAVRNAIDAGTFESASTSMGFADRSLMDNNQTYRFSAGLNFYTDTNTRNAIMITGGSNQDSDTMTRIAGNRAHLNISHPDFHVSIAQLARNTRWIDQPGQSIAYEGDLSPGQAVVFIGQLPTVAGRDFVHAIVCETFQADQEQMPVIDRQRSAQWWCENGPASLRAWANVSRVWSAMATHPYGEVAAPFEFTLEDGKIVRLEALCRPAVWPFCWWDAEGNPANENSGMLLLNGEPPEGMWAYVTVASTDPRENRRLGGQLDAPATDPQGPPSFSPLTDTFCQQIHDESAIDFGIAVGPWKQIGTLKMDIPQTIDGVTYTIRKPLAFGDKQFLIHFVQQGVVENQDELVAVDGSGKWASFSLLETAILQGHHANRQRLDRQPNFDGIALTDVKEWRLMQRKRQWKTFGNFATNPKTPPPAQAARQEAIAAEQVAKREEPLRKRQKWLAIPATRATDRGTARLFIDAIHTHDEAAVAALLTSNHQNVRQAIPAIAHYVVLQDMLRAAAISRFGEQEFKEGMKGCPGGYLLEDCEADFLDANWQKSADGTSHVDAFTFTRQSDGRFVILFDLDANVDAAAGARQFTGIVERLMQLMKSKPDLSLAEFKAALAKEIAAPMTQPAK